VYYSQVWQYTIMIHKSAERDGELVTVKAVPRQRVDN
jgi:hypothetical protein